MDLINEADIPQWGRDADFEFDEANLPDTMEIIGEKRPVDANEDIVDGVGKVSDEGTQVGNYDAEGLRKLDVVPVVEGSIGSSSCTSQRSKLRLCVEMNIKNKANGKETQDEEGGSNTNPVMVMVDYPDDVEVVVTARIQKLESDPSVHDIDEIDRNEAMIQSQGSLPSEDAVDQNQNKVLDTTFIKMPLSSTLIYPILEENESDEVVNSDEQKHLMMASMAAHGNSIRKSSGSGSGDQSVYHTVLCGNDGDIGEFGNISAIVKMENGSQSPKNMSGSGDVNLEKNPSAKLNSSALLFQSEEMTPGENLLKALHILARYQGVWGIYENEALIIKHIANLNRVLTMTDRATVYKTCTDEDYLEVRGLISYFNLEKRFGIRSELLQTFTLLSQKASGIGSYLFASEFTVELAKDVASGSYSLEETYAFASYLQQIFGSIQLSEFQCERIGDDFYALLCAMIVKFERKRCKLSRSRTNIRMSEILFEILLHYHHQLCVTDRQWQSLNIALGNRDVMMRIKQRLITALLNDISLSIKSESIQYGDELRKVKQILLLIHDLIVCQDKSHLFADSELDLVLVSLIHSLESVPYFEFRREALKTIHRILVMIKIEPSGLKKLNQLVIRMMKESHTQGDGDCDRSYRTVLKKIYKIISLSLHLLAAD